MKRVGVVLCALLLMLSVPSMLLAGGFVNKSNLSVEYLRTLNRRRPPIMRTSWNSTRPAR